MASSSSFFSPPPHSLKKTHSFSYFSPFPSLLRDFSSPHSLPRTRANSVAERTPHRERTHPQKNKPNSLLPPSRSIDGDSRKQRRWFKNEKEAGKPKQSEANSTVLEKKKLDEEKLKEKSKKARVRVKLDMCSKTGDLMGAISLYDAASKEGLEFGQYHYNVLLYLCSSAAMGVIHPAKSGSGNSNNSKSDNKDESDDDRKDLVMDEISECEEKSTSSGAIQVSDDIRDYARNRGFEIYEKMCLDDIPMSEAALTSVARMAMSTGDGDMAFDIVKQMKASGIPPRLRSYGPALLAFCDSCDVEKAFEVERHMSESGVQVEEPELEALLRTSVRARQGDKVYYLLHKMRTNVRQVSPSTADLIQAWFESVTASRVGKRKWDWEMVEQAMENGGGGWHGLGWLGKGKWAVVRTTVDDDGVCVNCGEKLVTIDLDLNETENFARSVASIASKRERNSSFQKFQRWLDYYGPFEAVVDAANVGLFSQRQFALTKVNTVVNAIRQKLPSKKCPLIILHNRRLIGRKMNGPLNGKLIEKWKNADAIYATPTGSNDDWYWLYAAIKCKCLIVTNDEMRDHVFQILGNDFFPRWKERHQVHFGYRDGNFELHFPPPCSIIIQESKIGHWHIPISEELDSRIESTWLCVTRGISHKRGQNSSISHKEMNWEKTSKSTSNACSGNHLRLDGCGDEHPNEKKRNTAANNSPKSYTCIVSKIEAAEKLSGCVLDFQI